MQQGQRHITGAQREHKSHAQGGCEGAKRTSRGELVLIRVLPGSGKSTMAQVLTQVGYVHYEADMYFMQDGQYQYDSRQIRQAHQWCREQTLHALQAGKRVVVSNTFTRLQEMEPYFSMTSDVRVVEATGRWQNVHGVPEETLQAMAERWETLPH